MSSRAVSALLLLTALACAPEPPPPPPQAKQQPPREDMTEFVDIDRDNLLTITSGAAVVSRTGELDLEKSAVQAIDGMHITRWETPPSGGSQTLVFSLGAPSRIERLGLMTYARPGIDLPEQVRFAASVDGTAWTEVGAIQPQSKREPQIVAVPPFDARYLRVRTIVPPPNNSTHLVSIFAYGRETAAPAPPLFDGCWTMSGRPSRITQNGARLTGVISGDQPTYLDGSVEGRLGRVMWTRGHMWGYAVLTLSADGRTIAGATFHQNPRTTHSGQSWIGQRCSATVELTPASPEVFLSKPGHWTVADAHAPAIAQLLSTTPGQRFRVTAYEFREKTPQENRRRAELRLASLRAALQQQGVDLTRLELVAADKHPDTELHFEVQRILWSRMDLTPLR